MKKLVLNIYRIINDYVSSIAPMATAMQYSCPANGSSLIDSL